MWMSHRPRKEMFTKIGIAVSTTAGAGAKKVTKSIAKQMFWWGIPRIYRMHFIVNAACWEEVPDRIKKIIAQKTAKLTHNVKRKIGKSKPGIKTVLFFNIFRKMQQSNTWNATDKDYWQKNNWLATARPWR
jgi:hypothetical protein